MDYASEIVLALVEPGDILKIAPNPKMPNLDRRITVDTVCCGYFLYGLSETCDGYSMPFWAIRSLKIVGKRK